jgi:hypothetical protein
VIPSCRVKLHSNPGIAHVCYQSVSEIYLQIHCTEFAECCTKNPDEGQLKVVPGFLCKSGATGKLRGDLYLAYNYKVKPFEPALPEFRMRVLRYREQTDKLVEPKTLIEDIPAWSNHTGGRMRFAADGTLFVTTGDANNPPLAQRLDTYNGKILRLKTDGTVPADNPYVHQDGARPEIWSYGYRNPQGLDFQPGTGRLLEAEHGPLGGDEINWLLPGHNYGWPVIDHCRSHEGMETPLLEFSPSIAPDTASFYRGQAFSRLHGNFLAGCLRGEGMLRAELDGSHVSKMSWLFHRTFAGSLPFPERTSATQTEN